MARGTRRSLQLSLWTIAGPVTWSISSTRTSPSPGPMLYSPNVVEHAFCELRHYGVLQSSHTLGMRSAYSAISSLLTSLCYRGRLVCFAKVVGSPYEGQFHSATDIIGLQRASDHMSSLLSPLGLLSALSFFTTSDACVFECFHKSSNCSFIRLTRSVSLDRSF